MEYDTIIIGAGVGGLSCALRLSSKGKRVLLLEKQPIPGGFATSFTRRGFVFESSLHCVDALGQDGEVTKFLQECDIDKRIDFIPLKDFVRIIYPKHNFVADFNPDHFVGLLKENFPNEAKGIDSLFAEFAKFYRDFDRFTNSRLPLRLRLIISPLFYSGIIKASCVTVEQFIASFIKDQKLKAIITDIWRFLGLPPSRASALYFLLIFRGYFYKPTFYIKGGFRQLFKAMFEKIEENGCQVRFNTTVKQIITGKDMRVKGIITDKGEEFWAKTVISNANAIDTLTRLIDKELIRSQYENTISKLEKSISAFQIYLGLRVPAKSLGMDQFMFFINDTYSHEENFNCCLLGDYDKTSISFVDHAQIDPSCVPPGKGSLLIMILDAYSNWQNLTEEEYLKRKKEVADKIINRAQKYLPGLLENIEVMEVATPRTMAHFGSAAEGAIYGFAQTVKQSGFRRLPQQTKVKGLFLAGAWTRPGGGVHACFVSGQDAASLTLRYLKRS